LTDPYVVEFTVEGEDFLAAGEASNNIKETLKMLGVPSSICRRAAVITYEAEMNLVIHARGGTLRAEITHERIELTARDEGPGIADVDLAMREGYSTAPDHVRELGFGAGMGLPNIKRNADALYIDSVVGRGTELRAVIYFDGEDSSGGGKRRAML
jgi:anti-sigma regulatory factor (Ser/Thr protein kinase)